MWAFKRLAWVQLFQHYNTGSIIGIRHILFGHWCRSQIQSHGSVYSVSLVRQSFLLPLVQAVSIHDASSSYLFSACPGAEQHGGRSPAPRSPTYCYFPRISSASTSGLATDPTTCQGAVSKIWQASPTPAWTPQPNVGMVFNNRPQNKKIDCHLTLLPSPMWRAVACSSVMPNVLWMFLSRGSPSTTGPSW